MDIIQHGTQSIIITDLFYATIFGYSFVLNWPWVAIIFFLIGIMPDLSGWIDGKMRGEKYRWDGAYNFFHKDLLSKNIVLSAVILFLFPGLVFHIIIDKTFHKPEGGWYNSGWIWNIASWIVTIIVGYITYFYVF